MNTIFLEKEQVYEGNLILINEKYQIVENQKKAMLQSLGHEVFLQAEAAHWLLSALKGIESNNQIIPVSGYRSMEEQTQIYKDTLAKKGADFTHKFVALPGHSEHQSGLAIDLGLQSDYIDYICPDFPYEGICEKFRQTAYAYGFVERYPKGKEYITGIAHEPWHFRYVGRPHAKVMKMQDWTLEEYVEKLKKYTQHGQHLKVSVKGKEIELFYIYAKEAKNKLDLYENRSYDISGDNTDGFIVTSWEKEK